MIDRSLDAEQLARDLLRIGAVTLSPKDPYTWSSGLKSPVYCDNRRTLGYPEIRQRIASAFKDVIRQKGWAVDVIAGTATAGIPHAAWLAEQLSLPMAYVRSKAKGHGKGNQIEGVVEKGDKVVVVEDLISTGGSVLTAVKALREAGAVVTGVLAIFTYAFPETTQRFAHAKVDVSALVDFPMLCKVAEDEGRLSSEVAETLQTWSASPKAWSEAYT